MSRPAALTSSVFYDNLYTIHANIMTERVKDSRFFREPLFGAKRQTGCFEHGSRMVHRKLRSLGCNGRRPLSGQGYIRIIRPYL